MSQLPPPMDPLPYATPQVPVPPRRPTSVTVIAIIAIIWGSIAVLGGMCALPQYLGVQLSPNPVNTALLKDAFYRAFNITAMAIAVVLAVLQLVGGITSLSLKRSGRQMLIWYAIIQIGIIVIGLPMQFLIYPRMVRDVQAVGMNSTVITAMRVGFFIGLTISFATIFWPILILYFMNRPHVKNAYERGM